MSRPHFVPMRTRTQSRFRPQSDETLWQEPQQGRNLRQKRQFHPFAHGWLSVTAILLILFFMMIGLPSLSAVLFHHTGRVSIETWVHTSDAGVQVKVYRTASNQVSIISLNDYITGVLAAEFTKDASPDALKAAAVACRTYVIHAKTTQQKEETRTNQQGADVTDSPTLDLPFMTDTSMRKQYGVDAPAFLSKLQSAVQSTDGLILTSQGKPILAFTTLVSPGTTRDAADAFGTPISYLKAIVCKEDVFAPNRIHMFTLSSRTVSQALDLSQIDLTKLTVSSIDKTGFVQTVMYGHTVWTGAKFTAALKLPSQKFSFVASGGKLRITTDGIGSGLGMSLNEANEMARAGKSWTNILATFYPGTTRELDTDYLVE